MRRSTLPCIAAILGWMLGGTSPAIAAHEPNVRPSIEVRRLVGEISIDGELADPGWAAAARATNWTETWPGDNAQPEIGHEAWIGYDDTHLYFAIMVTDEPAEVRASRQDRDEAWRDDYVGMIFDPFGTGAWAYELFLNPYGVQMDLRWTPNGEDAGFDIVWKSAGRFTDDGWQVEAAIPFSSLRFPQVEEQTWHGTFWHSRPRESRLRYSWAAGNRDDPCWPCNWGRFTGIRGVEGAGSVDLLPSVTAYDVSGLADPDVPTDDHVHLGGDVDVGLGLRYAINSSYAVEATVNPDFSQVESDEAQIDANTTFALFYDERRPFFQEGSDLYASKVNAIYTRSINNPLWAGKLTGRTENSSVALLVARDEDSPLIVPFEEKSEIFALGRSHSVIFRSRSRLYGDSYAGSLFTMRQLDDGGHNLVYGLDSMVRFANLYQAEAQWLLSESREPEYAPANESLSETFGSNGHTEALDGEVFGGEAGYFSLAREGRHFGWKSEYRYLGDTFRADSGAIFQNNRQMWITTSALSWPVDNALFDEVVPFFMAGRVWNASGIKKDEWLRGEMNLRFKSQTNVEIGYLISNELFGGQQLDGIRRWNVEIDSQFSEYLSGHAEYEAGTLVARRASPAKLGDGQTFRAGLNIRPLDRLTIEPSFTYQKLVDPDTGGIAADGFFEGHIARARLNFQVSSKLVARLVLQYDAFDDRYDVEPLLTYRINPFTAIYAGGSRRFADYGDEFDGIGIEATEVQYFAKVQWLFRN